MSGMEVVATVAFLLLGYWIVSAIWDKFVSPGKGCASDNNTSSASSEGPVSEQSTNKGAHEDIAPISSSWFQVLGVTPDASRDEIVAAYREKIGQYDADVVTHMGSEIRELAEVKSRQINAAYNFAMKLRR